MGIALACIAGTAFADEVVNPFNLVTQADTVFHGYTLAPGITAAASRLFWALATISLVWTMGMMLVRQDIGEALMELVRFTIVTGTFYWLLINASDAEGGAGFVNDIVRSFFEMLNVTDMTFKGNADDVLARGVRIYYGALLQTGDGDVGDKVLAGLLGAGVLVASALMAAQFLLALIMAWLLGYAAIFLLGFGGARWTSPIAINYYKHVLAIGIAMLCLSIIGTVASVFLDGVFKPAARESGVNFEVLGATLAAFVLLAVLSIRVPQLMYTMVTGSTLGLFAGTAGIVGSTIVTGGGAALAAAARGGMGGGAPGGTGRGMSGASGTSGGGSGRADSAMDAVQRSATSMASAGDPFHVGTASDPFGVPRAGRHGGGSAFASPADGASLPAATGSVVSAVSAFGRDLGLSDGNVGNGAASDAAVIVTSTGRGGGTSRQGAGEPNADVARPDYEAELSAISAQNEVARNATDADNSVGSGVHVDSVPQGPVSDDPTGSARGSVRGAAALEPSAEGNVATVDVARVAHGAASDTLQSPSAVTVPSHVSESQGHTQTERIVAAPPATIASDGTPLPGSADTVVSVGSANGPDVGSSGGDAPDAGETVGSSIDVASGTYGQTSDDASGSAATAISGVTSLTPSAEGNHATVDASVPPHDAHVDSAQSPGAVTVPPYVAESHEHTQTANVVGLPPSSVAPDAASLPGSADTVVSAGSVIGPDRVSSGGNAPDAGETVGSSIDVASVTHGQVSDNPTGSAATAVSGVTAMTPSAEGSHATVHVSVPTHDAHAHTPQSPSAFTVAPHVSEAPGNMHTDNGGDAPPDNRGPTPAPTPTPTPT